MRAMLYINKVWKRLTVRALLVLTAIVCLPPTAGAQSDSTRIYTESHPLVYEDAWDLWPYTFLNENGEPDGFNIDLLKLLFKELDIPYIIKLKPTKDALAALRDGTSDLMLGMYDAYHRDYAKHGESIVQLFTHSVVFPKAHPTAIHSLEDLANNEVIVHEGSFSHKLMVEKGWGDNAILYGDMKEAIRRVSSEQHGEIVWNTMSLKWLIHKYQIENLSIEPIDVPAGEYKFMSNNSQLLHRLDSAYTVLLATEQIQPILNKWFYPERQESGIPSSIWKLTAGLALAVVGILLYYLSYRIRERKTTQDVRKSNDRLSLILRTSGVGLWTYRVDSKMFTWIDSDGNAVKDYTILEFSRRYRPEDFKQLTNAINELARQKKESLTMNLRAKEKSEGGDERDFTIALSVLRRDKNGRPAVIIGTRSDITEERLRQIQVEDTMLRYQAVFNTAMVDMMYFDKNGVLIDLNKKACETLKGTRKEILDRRINVTDMIGPNDISLKDLTYFHTTMLMGEGQDRYYYEIQLVPIHDEQRQLLGIYGTGRDISEIVHTYHKQQQAIASLQQSTAQVNGYLGNIDYVLKIGGVRIANYYPDRHVLDIYSKTDTVQFSMTPTRCMTLVSEASKKTAIKILNNMDNGTHDIINADVETTIKRNGKPLCIRLNFVPITRQDGSVAYYYGMFRDISETKAVEHQLQLQTVKAQEVETVKNAFLHNMSYEIRTPLNTVVGFAELFEMEHSAEDESVFISEIKESSAKLLKLINDILFLSRLDAQMIEIKPKPTDFATVFEPRCQMGWSSNEHTDVSLIVESPYKHLVVDIDDQNLSIVIDKVISNAAQHTVKGTVRARYDYFDNQLIITIEDTGNGIPKELLGTIFERFSTGASNGTGLGLSICHELMAQMGGNININSVVGKGTTVWISIPCTATEIERK